MTRDTAHTEEYRGLVIRLEHDQGCESPLEGDSEPTITYCASSRYNLGNLACSNDEHTAIARRIRTGEFVGLPVFAYVHSGIALSTGNSAYPFTDPWDSGQSGWIYMEREKILTDWYPGKILTAARRNKALDQMRRILNVFAQWLNGECYGYRICLPDSSDEVEGEELDSCWGYVGMDSALECARESADWHVANIVKRKRESWRKALHEAREARYWAVRDVPTVRA